MNEKLLELLELTLADGWWVPLKAYLTAYRGEVGVGRLQPTLEGHLEADFLAHHVDGALSRS